jgi:hypothetical protein
MSMTRRNGGVSPVAVAAAILALGCAGGGIRVRTAIAPDANFANARTFRFLPSGNTTPVATAGPNGAVAGTATGDVVTRADPTRSENPIIENPITLEMMRHDVDQAMTARGYQRVRGDADLSLAQYISVRKRLHVTDYAYGYPFWGWGWRWGPGWGAWPQQQITEYEQGTVIIDVLDGPARRLLWRGMGRMSLSGDEKDYDREIKEAVDAVMAKFPGHAMGG